VGAEINTAKRNSFLLRFEFRVTKAQKHGIRNNRDARKSEMAENQTHARETGDTFNRRHDAEQIKPPKKAARKRKRIN
jgi:hypothetical protein